MGSCGGRLRWGGGVVEVGGMQGKKMSAKELKSAYPDEPWHWRPEWHTGRIKGSRKLEAVIFGLMGLVFFGLSLPALTALPKELERGNYALLVVLLFTIIGLVLMFLAAKAFLQVLRYETLIFRPDPMPGSWRGWVSGAIVIPKGARVIGAIDLELACIHKTVSGSGKNRRVSEVPIWAAKESRPAATVQGMGPIVQLPVKFQVPRDSGKPTDGSE